MTTPAQAQERDALLNAAIDFIATLTGMKPPPIEVAPPEVFAPFLKFVDEVQAITARAALTERPAATQTIEHECETCSGEGTIDETVGGGHFLNPKATCPDCNGQGYWIEQATPVSTQIAPPPGYQGLFCEDDGVPTQATPRIAELLDAPGDAGIPASEHNGESSSHAGTTAPTLTDAQIDAVTEAQWGKCSPDPRIAHRAYARAILAAVASQDASNLSHNHFVDANKMVALTDEQRIDLLAAALYIASRDDEHAILRDDSAERIIGTIESLIDPSKGHSPDAGKMVETEIRWPTSRDVGRMGDMTPVGQSVLRVGLDASNDVFVNLWDFGDNGRPDDFKDVAIEFCNGSGGGGKSPCTRAALINLMSAIEADNANDPSKAWVREGEFRRATS